MRLLLDQNISFRLVNSISSNYKDVQHVRILGLENAADIEIWHYAKKHKYAIVTFDADFSDYASIFGQPPKIIWLRTGNKTTTAIAEMLLQKADIIDEFLHSEKYIDISCLELV